MRMRYRREDVDYILDHYQELRLGIDPDPANAESEGRVTSRYNATGRELIEWATEVAARVKLCGLDGLLVYTRYGMGAEPPKLDGEIEREWHIDLYEVGRRINRVKWYCVGHKRGWHLVKKTGERVPMTYEEWRGRNRR